MNSICLFIKAVLFFLCIGGEDITYPKKILLPINCGILKLTGMRRYFCLQRGWQHTVYIVSAAPLHNTALDVQHLCIYQVPVPAMGCSAGKAFWLPEVILGCDPAAMSM